MQSNIENALKNIEQVEVPSSTYDKVDNVLRSLDERKDITDMKPRFKKPAVIAAVIAISLFTFSTAALAYTGVLSGLFTAITNSADTEGEFGTDTRKSIIEHDQVVEITPITSIADDGSALKLNAYFVDSREIWFDFTLSNAAIPDDWAPDRQQVLPGIFSLNMTYSDGAVNKWEYTVDENLSEKSTFPGGYFFVDRINDTHGEEASDDSHRFVYQTIGSFTDDGSLDMTVIVQFSYPYPIIGERINLQIGNLLFSVVDWDLFV